jgi:DUF1680 family protein
LIVESSPKKSWKLSLRIPGWCKKAELTINGKLDEGKQKPGTYAVLDREWRQGDKVELRLSIPPVLYEAHPHVEPTRCALAMTRGPLLYCLENIDQEAGASIMDCTIDPTAAIRDEWNEELLRGVVTLKARGVVEDSGVWQGKLYRDYGESSQDPPKGRSTTLTAIPYYAWANRGPTPMRTWIPMKTSG